MNILVICKLQKTDQEEIQKTASASCDFIFRDHIEDCSKKEIESAEVVFGNIPTDLVHEFQNTKWLQLGSAGYERFEGIQLPEGLILTFAAGGYGINISEYMIGGVLSILQNFHRIRDNQFRGEWKDEGLGGNITGSVCLIAGTGNIGGEFAKRLKLLGAAKTIGFRRNASICPEFFDEVHPLSRLKEFLPGADIIGTCLPASPQSHQLFDRSMIHSFKKNAVFVNVGRGSAVDLSALCDAITNNQIRGAVLDVTDPEPLPKDHPAWHVRNLIITPHISGGFRENLNPTLENCISLRCVIDLFLDNLARYQKNEALRNIAEL